MVIQLLKRHFLKNKGIFSLFILCQLVSLLAALFVVNLIFIRKDLSYTGQEFYRMISIASPGNDDVYAESIEQLLRSNALGSLERVESSLTDAEANITVEVVLYSASSARVMEAGRDFTEQETLERTPVAIVNPRFSFAGEPVKVGDLIEFREVQYEVIGLCSGMDCMLQIPYNPSMAGECNALRLLHKTGISQQQKNDLLHQLRSIFPGTEPRFMAEIPEPTWEFTGDDLLIVLVLVIVNINFFALYYFILNRGKAAFAIFQICGCSRARARRLLLEELGIICSATFVFSAVLFHFLIAPPVFHLVHPLIQYTFSPAALIRTALLYLVGVFAVFLPIVYKFEKESRLALCETGGMQ